MEVPTEVNAAVQSAHEPQVVPNDADRIDQVLESSPYQSQNVDEDKEMTGEVLGKTQAEFQNSDEETERGFEGTQTPPESQNLDEVPQTESSEPQIVAEEMEKRPSLEAVWESLQSAAASHNTLLEQQDAAQEKGRVSEEPQTSPELQDIPEIKTRVKPSSLRTRPSTRAKRNVTFKDDLDKVEDNSRIPRSGNKRQAGERRQIIPPGCIGIILSVALASLIIYIATPSVPTKPRMWTSAELRKYNGTDNKPPVLLGILGSVFDVSKGWKHYGPGGSYHHFVGRDASRAFVSGNFTEDGLTDSLEGLTASQIKAIDDWRLFFVSRYVYLGKLVGTFYNKEGLPTKKLHQAEKKVKQATKFEKQQKLDEEQFPNCNSRWSQDTGGEVWCNDGKYPRITESVTEGPRKGPPRTRCACLEAEELQRPGLKGYEGCDAQSSMCKT